MSDIYAATDGTAGGNGSQSMPYDLDTALTAQTATDRLIVMPGVYAQDAVVGSGKLIEGHFTGRPIIYGGAQITGTWAPYSGRVWRIATANPVASALGKLPSLMALSIACSPDASPERKTINRYVMFF